MHNFFILLILLLFSSMSYGKWTLSRSYGDINIYISANQTRLTVSFKEDLSKDFKITKDMIEKTAGQKRQMLSMMGLADWKVSSNRVTTQKDSAKLYIQGEYTDSKSRKVHFVERHYYTPKGALQMLFTHSDLAVLRRDSREKELKSIKQEYDF